jgi:acetyl esterase/lipase
MSYFYKYVIVRQDMNDPPLLLGLKGTSSRSTSPQKPELSPCTQISRVSRQHTAEIDVLRSEGMGYAQRLQEEGDGCIRGTVMGVPLAFPR